MMRLAMFSLGAVVFDLDGTLVDNMGFHLRAWQELGARLGRAITVEQFERDFSGRKNDEIFPALLGRALAPAELEALAAEKEARYRALYLPFVQPMPGSNALLARLAAAGVPLAVASAAPAENREMVLGALGWRNRFQVVQGPEGQRGKPWPDIFLAAASALGVAPERCLAFEDAVHGVTSACAAGMQVAGICSTTPAEVLRGAGARWTSRNFDDLSEALVDLLP